jgi:putative sugar O-methyltransferase
MLTRPESPIDDPELLDLMMRDEEKQKPIYRAGPFWRAMAESVCAQIKRVGIGDFRGSSSTIGWGFCDNVYQDVRIKYSPRKPGVLDRLLSCTPIFRHLNANFEEQLSLTRTYETWAREAAYGKILRNPRTQYLLEKYSLADTVRFGCLDRLEINRAPVSRHYLKLLDQHDRSAQHLDFTKVRIAFEIGGGFGINTHIWLQNYPNIRKFLYLDIAPNLYVGTQYLKSLYGSVVRDYRETRSLRKISFENNESLEIITIAPWQIECTETQIDLFMNAHSFAEIPEDSVANYAAFASQFMHQDSQISLSTYYSPEGSPVLTADKLPTFFPGRNFTKSEHENLDGGGATFFYLSR